MSIWIILSWVFVLLLTAINVFVFLKLKTASEQMMKMAFPGARNSGEAMAQMQSMMSKLGGMGGMPGAKPGASGDAQLRAAMDMLQKMKKGR